KIGRSASGIGGRLGAVHPGGSLARNGPSLPSSDGRATHGKRRDRETPPREQTRPTRRSAPEKRRNRANAALRLASSPQAARWHQAPPLETGGARSTVATGA